MEQRSPFLNSYALPVQVRKPIRVHSEGKRITQLDASFGSRSVTVVTLADSKKNAGLQKQRSKMQEIITAGLEMNINV